MTRHALETLAVHAGRITHSLVLDALLCFWPLWAELKKR